MSNGNESEDRGDQGADQNADQGEGITDDQLPEDLQPTDDNPLAQNTEDSEYGGDPDEDRTDD